MKNRIKKLAKAHAKNAIGWRRTIHANPELSFEEHETSQLIADVLSQHGIAYTRGWAGTGIVAEIKGLMEGHKILALRADMDALPINEKTNVSYQSKNEGIMHACGHDVHTANLLGAAVILQNLREEFGGTIKLIFQPGEEKLPGGASILIKEGVLEDPKPHAIIGLHVHPPLKAGKVGFHPGTYMASADELYVTVIGKGGHAAVPHKCVDPILVASHIVTSLQQIVSRHADPTIPTVLSFGKINSTGGATNVIPNEVKLEGTFRTFDEKWRAKAKKQMKKLATGIAKSMGATCIFDIKHGYPFLHNDEALTRRIQEHAVQYLGKSNVVDLPKRMTSEDFAFYSHQVPACFYRLGTGNIKEGITSGVHTDTFNIDESALEMSIGLSTWLAISELNDLRI